MSRSSQPICPDLLEEHPGQAVAKDIADTDDKMAVTVASQDKKIKKPKKIFVFRLWVVVGEPKFPHPKPALTKTYPRLKSEASGSAAEGFLAPP